MFDPTSSRSRVATRVLCALAVLWGGALDAQGVSPRERARVAGERLVEADRELSARSAEVGFRDAMGARLAERSTLYGAAGPMTGPDWVASVPDLPGSLTWGPDWVEMAPDASMGVTSGPYRFRPDGAGSGAADERGRYLAVWQREAGEWRIQLHVGLAEPSGDPPAEPPIYAQDLESIGRPVEGASVALADRRWASQVQRLGTDGALETLGTHRVRILRTGRAVRAGWSDVQNRPVDDPVVAETRALGGACSEDGNLCWIHGRWADPSGAAGVWVRVWRAHVEGGWALIADLRRRDGT